MGIAGGRESLTDKGKGQKAGYFAGSRGPQSVEIRPETTKQKIIHIFCSALEVVEMIEGLIGRLGYVSVSGIGFAGSRATEERVSGDTPPPTPIPVPSGLKARPYISIHPSHNSVRCKGACRGRAGGGENPSHNSVRRKGMCGGTGNTSVTGDLLSFPYPRHHLVGARSGGLPGRGLGVSRGGLGV